MVVCGDDALARRLAAELRDVYRERVVLVVPEPQAAGAPTRAAALASALLGRVPFASPRVPGTHGPAAGDDLDVVSAPVPDETVLDAAGVGRASALALVYEDDATNVRAALAARRLNPRLRLVIRLYNRKLGQHLAQLLDQATPGVDPAVLDTSTTVLSDADTAAPALAATAVAGTSKVVQADGMLLRAVEHPPPGDGRVPDPGLCTLALLSSTTSNPAGMEGSDDSGPEGPRLLPDDEEVAAAGARGTIALETVTYAGPPPPVSRLGAALTPLVSLFSRRLWWSITGVVGAVLALTVASMLTLDDHPLHAAYTILLDIFAINDPAIGQPATRKVLQILAGLAGLLLLPVLVAGLLEALGTFRSASALGRVSRRMSGHVVLLGLGKVGTRVLARLHELDIPVVCVEENPEARGISLARRLRVPVVLGDVTQEGVLESARVHRAQALLALTSSDTTNLEATLYARSLGPALRVSLRLYDDEFATAVFRTLRTAHPDALTRSRSVSHLAAPAFAGAMMGRQVLGAVPVERKVLLFAALDVMGHPQLQGRTVAEAFRPGAWRVIALDTAAPGERLPDLSAAVRGAGGRAPNLVWDLHPGYVLKPEDRVVLAATRRGLAELLGRQPQP
ncbi:NAD(P)-binding protein [Streptomyces sp. MUM 2J]|uniref:NAD-binding protein n=1 Tax=Streptomyces sp. MUM 2J TaxID=2791987 RepID=UPI001F048390|nr:NAD(P)-binding protein [Streptomyces sp. MUM 2J]MCH0566702.1 NAD-binding protein [Streptomyces sp. MUM 2J]